MKKNLLRFATLVIIGAMAAFSCGEKDPVNNDEPGDEPDDPKDEVSIVIDGDFTDWGLVTAETDGAVVGTPTGDLKKIAKYMDVTFCDYDVLTKEIKLMKQLKKIPK